MQQLLHGNNVSQDNMKDEFSVPISNSHVLGLKHNPQSSTRILLLVLLLSFSLLFHQTATSESFGFQTPNRTVSELALSATPKMEKEKSLSSPQNLPKKVEKQNSGVTQQKAAKRVLRHEKTSSTTRSVKRRKESVKQQQSPITPPPATTQTTPDQRSIIPEIIQWRPNTTYLICNNVSQIVPPPSVLEPQRQTPAMVSLLIPPDALGTSQQNSLLEVTCQVMDVNFVPLRS